jgi:hypothetical protein
MQEEHHLWELLFGVILTFFSGISLYNGIKKDGKEFWSMSEGSNWFVFVSTIVGLLGGFMFIIGYLF